MVPKKMNDGSTQKTEKRFRSRSEHLLDDKGRLNIPSRFREILNSSCGGEALVATNWHRCVKAFPAGEWELVEEKLIQQGKNEAGLESFIRYVISGVTECPLDRQGRILLPPALRNDLLPSREIVLNGMLDHFEIWDQKAWNEESRRARDNFSAYSPGLSRLGIL